MLLGGILLTTEENFLALLKKMSAYGEAISIMYWDMRTGAPKKGIPADQRQLVHYHLNYLK